MSKLIADTLAAKTLPVAGAQPIEVSFRGSLDRFPSALLVLAEIESEQAERFPLAFDVLADLAA